jgi:hypothetical protein
MAMSDLGSGPTVKAIAMARAPITAVMKATYFNELSKKNELPPGFAKVYTSDPAKFMIAYTKTLQTNLLGVIHEKYTKKLIKSQFFVDYQWTTGFLAASTSFKRDTGVV